MSFNDAGYLSLDIQQWSVTHRGKHAQWFSLAEQLNSIAMKALFLSAPPRDDVTRLIATLAFCRLSEHFQSALVLASYGASSSARSLIRNSVEAAIALKYLASGLPDFVDILAADNLKHRTSYANVLLGDQKLREPIQPEKLNKLRDMLEESKDTTKQSIKWDQLAKEAGCSDLYNIIYRQVSADSAHLSVDSLHRHIVTSKDEEILGMKYQPDDVTTADTIFLATSVMLNGLASMLKLFDLTNFEADLKDIAIAHNKLIVESSSNQGN